MTNSILSSYSFPPVLSTINSLTSAPVLSSSTSSASFSPLTPAPSSSPSLKSQHIINLTNNPSTNPENSYTESPVAHTYYTFVKPSETSSSSSQSSSSSSSTSSSPLKKQRILPYTPVTQSFLTSSSASSTPSNVNSSSSSSWMKISIVPYNSSSPASTSSNANSSSSSSDPFAKPFPPSNKSTSSLFKKSKPNPSSISSRSSPKSFTFTAASSSSIDSLPSSDSAQIKKILKSCNQTEVRETIHFLDSLIEATTESYKQALITVKQQDEVSLRDPNSPQMQKLQATNNSLINLASLRKHQIKILEMIQLLHTPNEDLTVDSNIHK